MTFTAHCILVCDFYFQSTLITTQPNKTCSEFLKVTRPLLYICSEYTKTIWCSANS